MWGGCGRNCLEAESTKLQTEEPDWMDVLCIRNNFFSSWEVAEEVRWGDENASIARRGKERGGKSKHRGGREEFLGDDSDVFEVQRGENQRKEKWRCWGYGQFSQKMEKWRGNVDGECQIKDFNHRREIARKRELKDARSEGVLMGGKFEEEVENEKRWENCKSSFRLIRETVGYDV